MSTEATNLPAISAQNLAVLVAADPTIKKYEREIQAEMDAIRVCRQRIAIARGAIRNQTNFLKRQNAEFLRELAGTRVVPGQQAPRETPRQAQKRIRREYQDALKKAQLEAAGETAPTPPDETAPAP